MRLESDHTAAFRHGGEGRLIAWQGPTVLFRRLTSHREFRIGLLVKVIAVLCLAPELQRALFNPFLLESMAESPLDPWSVHVGVNPEAFPYGPPMAYLLSFGALWGSLFGALGFTSPLVLGLGVRATLLGADFILLLALAWRYHSVLRLVIRYYWLSPIVFFVTYWHGQFDIIPMSLLLVGMVLILTKENIKLHLPQPNAAPRKIEVPKALGALLGALAVGAKLSTALAVPFLLTLMVRNRLYRPLLGRTIQVGAATFALVWLPWLVLSGGFRKMVTGTPELLDVYEFAIVFESTAGPRAIYILPLIIASFLYLFWRTRRPTSEFLFYCVGIAYLILVSFTPTSPGWYLWLVPFVASYPIEARTRFRIVLLLVYNVLVVSFILIMATGAAPLGMSTPPTAGLEVAVMKVVGQHGINLLYTVMATTGLFLAASMFIHARRVHGEVILSRGTISIGIAGDSGTGKDTLSAAIANVFERGASASISGDDYHRFERGSPMWKRLTHLNPRANYLTRFSRDVFSLLHGEAILCRHYDHRNGRFIPNVRISGNEVVLVSGLHGFYTQALSRSLNVCIYLDMHEGLRRYFKIRRDVRERGKVYEKVVESIEERMADFNKYVRPQKLTADLIFRIEPANDRDIDNPLEGEKLPRLRLGMLLPRSLPIEEMAIELLALGGVMIERVESDPERPDLANVVVAEDGLEASLFSAVAQRFIPHLDELIVGEEGWHSGALGMMQLMVLVHLSDIHRQGIGMENRWLN